MFLHGYRMVCEISTVGSLALKRCSNNPFMNIQWDINNASISIFCFLTMSLSDIVE